MVPVLIMTSLLWGSCMKQRQQAWLGGHGWRGSHRKGQALQPLGHTSAAPEHDFLSRPITEGKAPRLVPRSVCPEGLANPPLRFAEHVDTADEKPAPPSQQAHGRRHLEGSLLLPAERCSAQCL